MPKKAKKTTTEEKEAKKTAKKAAKSSSTKKEKKADDDKKKSKKKADTKEKKKDTKKAKKSDKKSKKKKKKKEKVDLKKKNHFVLNEKSSKKAHWYVIHTYSGHENRVAIQLMQRVKTMKLDKYIHELLIPTQKKIQIKRGKKKDVQEKIFPGYMLVKMEMDDQAWFAVRTTSGVTSFVGTGSKPTPLPPDEVESIKKFVEQDAPKYKAAFSIGEAVKIVEGPFADFLGTVDSIDEAKGKVNVLVSIFGRETPVELDFLQVTKI